MSTCQHANPRARNLPRVFLLVLGPHPRFLARPPLRSRLVRYGAYGAYGADGARSFFLQIRVKFEQVDSQVDTLQLQHEITVWNRYRSIVAEGPIILCLLVILCHLAMLSLSSCGRPRDHHDLKRGPQQPKGFSCCNTLCQGLNGLLAFLFAITVAVASATHFGLSLGVSDFCCQPDATVELALHSSSNHTNEQIKELYKLAPFYTTYSRPNNFADQLKKDVARAQTTIDEIYDVFEGWEVACPPGAVVNFDYLAAKVLYTIAPLTNLYSASTVAHTHIGAFQSSVGRTRSST